MDFMSLFTYQNVAIAMLVFIVLWVIWLKPFLQKKANAGEIIITEEQLKHLDDLVQNAALFANDMYHSRTADERKQLALDFAFEELEKSDIIPKEYLTIVRDIIEGKLDQVM
jgi:hypothetical protein